MPGYIKTYVDIRRFRLKSADLPAQTPKPADVKIQKIVCRDPHVLTFEQEHPQISFEIRRSQGTKNVCLHPQIFPDLTFINTFNIPQVSKFQNDNMTFIV